MIKGTIVSLDFGAYHVMVDNQIYRATMPKTDKIKLSPVVGDQVDIDIAAKHILDIYPRDSFIKRPRLANLSHLFIVSSLVEPEFSFHLLAVFISFARFYNLNVTIIITKTDAGTQKHFQTAWDYLTANHFPLLFFSKFNPDLSQLKALILPGKIVAFAGQTGVGKSTIVNALNPDFSRKIGSYSQALGRGKHQTKEVILLPFQGAFIADTPGFSSLELPMLKQDAAKVFPGFETRFSQCKFFNCIHQHEPGCYIQAEVNRGKIPLEIYQDYLKLIAKLPEKKEFN
jgi:ribosome biogenesis GTPase / thiamine phosphate phosphatase